MGDRISEVPRCRLSNDRVILEPADAANVNLLIRWTLDPRAQEPYKRIPPMNADALREQFLNSPDRAYFLIRPRLAGQELGRFYWRAWRFPPRAEKIDWELNIFIADPLRRGLGYGSEVQRLAVSHLLTLNQTRSVFAYTYAVNHAEQRALEKAGLRRVGFLPDAHYQVDLPEEKCVLFAIREGAD